MSRQANGASVSDTSLYFAAISGRVSRQMASAAFPKSFGLITATSAADSGMIPSCKDKDKEMKEGKVAMIY